VGTGVLRTKDGKVVEANDEAVGLLGECVGQRCAIAVAALGSGGEAVCTATCAFEVETSSCHGEVVVQDEHVRMTCTRTGEEVVVLLEECAGVQDWTDRLSPREGQILALVAQGLTRLDIASELGLSPSTVRTHMEHARRKLGARSRAQAVAKAITTGQLDL